MENMSIEIDNNSNYGLHSSQTIIDEFPLVEDFNNIEEDVRSK